MTEPRYYVVALTGYPAGKGSAHQATSYSVLDSCAAHVEVYVAYAQAGGSPERVRRQRCYRECARLNALEGNG